MPALIWLVITFGLWLIRSGPRIARLFFNGVCRIFVAPFVTPPSHRRYGDYGDSEACESLSRDGYGIDARWATDAVASIERK